MINNKQFDTQIEDREPESWVSIIGYEHNYLISSHGAVKSLSWNRSGKQRQLKHILDKDGYLTIALCKNGVRKTLKIHRLVGIHFIGNPNNLPEINHKYGNKKNNYFKDLEWSSHPDNMRHSYATGLKPRTTEKHLTAVRLSNSKRKGIKYKTSIL